MNNIIIVIRTTCDGGKNGEKNKQSLADKFHT